MVQVLCQELYSQTMLGSLHSLSFNTQKVNKIILALKEETDLERFADLLRVTRASALQNCRGYHSHRSPCKWCFLDLCSRTQNLEGMVPLGLNKAVVLVFTQEIVTESRAEPSSHSEFTDSFSSHKKD